MSEKDADRGLHKALAADVVVTARDKTILTSVHGTLLFSFGESSVFC